MRIDYQNDCQIIVQMMIKAIVRMNIKMRVKMGVEFSNHVSMKISCWKELKLSDYDTPNTNPKPSNHNGEFTFYTGREREKTIHICSL